MSDPPRCHAKHPGMGAQCTLDAGHDGNHTTASKPLVVIPESMTADDIFTGDIKSLHVLSASGVCTHCGRSGKALQAEPCGPRPESEPSALVEEARKALAKATPGPWAWAQTAEKGYGANVGAECYTESDFETPLSGDLSESPDDFYVSQPIAELSHQNAAADAAFIASAPDLIRRLADALEARQRIEVRGKVA